MMQVGPFDGWFTAYPAGHSVDKAPGTLDRIIGAVGAELVVMNFIATASAAVGVDVQGRGTETHLESMQVIRCKTHALKFA